MNWRPRSTGEIIALTMAEVFLTFLFVVLTFTTIREVESADFDERLRQYMEQNRQLAADNEELRERAESLEHERDEWRRRYQSEFPPLCPQRGRFYAVITLVGGEQLEVFFHEDMAGTPYRTGDRARVTRPRFESLFGPLLAEAKRAGCRYAATIRDTDAVSKEELKRLQKVVKRYFYADLQ